MNNFKWIWQYAKVYKRTIFWALLFIFINAALIVINPLLTGKIVDVVIDKNQTQWLVPILVTMIVVTLIRTVVRYAYQILFERVGQNTLYVLRQDMYKKLQELDFDFFNHTRVGDIMARMTGDTDAIRHFVSWVTYNILECVIWFVLAMLVMMTLSVPLTLAMLVVTPFIYYFTRKMSNEAHPIFFEIRESFSRLNSMVEENIGGNRVVKAFVREAYEIEKFNEHNEDYKQKNMESAKVSSKYLPWLDMFAGSLSLISLGMGGFLVMKDQMTIGDLIAFNGFLWMLNMPLRMSGWLINDVQRFSAACIKIREMLTTTPQIPVEMEKMETKIHGDVEFDHVTFRFSDDPDTAILSNVSFSIHPGQTIGILGETGSGKTTLVNLVARFYDATEGMVKIDGKDIKDYPVRQLRDNIAMVMQDIFLFSDTIEENIAFGAPGAESPYIREMARIADADFFIQKMPQGYDTVIGERGVGLSGGQKQRISLARALAKNPAILILDDTTSAVDMETETKIQKELQRLTQTKTTFIIAHRISSVRDADIILMMEKGKVVEQGTHVELVQRKGSYYEVYRKQLGIEIGKEEVGKNGSK